MSDNNSEPLTTEITNDVAREVGTMTSMTPSSLHPSRNLPNAFSSGEP